MRVQCRRDRDQGGCRPGRIGSRGGTNPGVLVLRRIDGRGGAGKTTLAERLCKVVPTSAVVHTDDIAWNHAYFDWGAVLVENILQPLHKGEALSGSRMISRRPAWLLGFFGTGVVP